MNWINVKLAQMNLNRLSRACALSGKSEKFKSAGAASPRIDPGTCENPQPVVARLSFLNCGSSITTDVLHV